MTHFVRAFKNIEGEDGIAWKQARQYHLHDVQNLFRQEDQKAITMKQEIDLPFCCDSDFLVWGSYQGTGFWFDSWKVPRKTKKKKSRSLEEDDDYDIINVLTIQLVAEEKVATKKSKRKLQGKQQGFQSTFAALRARMAVVKMRIGVFHTMRMRTQSCT
jgi:hypothetical protein